MKSLSVLLLCTACFVWAAQAQAPRRVGARFGYQLSTITGDEDDTEGIRMCHGTSGGLIAEGGRKVVFSSGVLISTQGATWIDDRRDERETLRTTYLRFPLEVKANIGNMRNKVTGYINAGPFIAVWVAARFIYTEAGERTVERGGVDGDTNRRLDAGLTAGGGVSFNFGRHRLQAGPAFSMGFVNITRYRDGQERDEKPNLNIVIAALNVTYLFKTKG